VAANTLGTNVVVVASTMALAISGSSSEVGDSVQQAYLLNTKVVRCLCTDS
jgi:hypothetical protein